MTSESVPQFSEDRQWWWTGSEWVRAYEAPKRAAVELLIQVIKVAGQYRSTTESNEPNRRLNRPSDPEEFALIGPPRHDSGHQATQMPGATGYVRELPNGAIVSGSGYYYWSGWKWKPLVAKPPVKPPGNYSRERLRELPSLVRGKSIGAMGEAGTELCRLVSEAGSLEAAERQLQLAAGTPEDAIRSPDGTQWWDGAAWRRVEIPANAVRSPDGHSWWDGSVWQPVHSENSGSAETSNVARPKTSLTQKPQPARVKQAEILVKTYRDAKNYERDAKRMAAQGWQPQGQTQGGGHLNMGRTVSKAVIFLPWAILRPSRKGDPITVTWVRQ